MQQTTALAETLDGGAGNDILRSHDGNELHGAAGNDVQTGNAGDDLLSGGDLVADFQNGIDWLNLHLLGFNTFDQVQILAHATISGIYIDLSNLGGGSIMVDGLTLATFAASDVVPYVRRDRDALAGRLGVAAGQSVAGGPRVSGLFCRRPRM